MVTAGEIKARINGIQDTKKITDAMYMISSAKMRRAILDLEQTTPYFEALTEKIGDLFHYIPKTENRYFKITVPEDLPHLNHGVLLITSDKGLAGVYNAAAIQVCEEFMRRHPRTMLFIIGEYGRQYFSNKNIEFVREFKYSARRPSLNDARRICTELLEYYNDEILDEINIIYTDYMGTKPGVSKKVTLLPLEKTRFYQENDTQPAEKELLPSPDEVLNGVIPSYLTGFIYSCLTESFSSEQQARMIAMKNASDNAEKMLKTLKVQYNKIRQAAITNEMIEIAAGARALKKNGADRPLRGKQHE